MELVRGVAHEADASAEVLHPSKRRLNRRLRRVRLMLLLPERRRLLLVMLSLHVRRLRGRSSAQRWRVERRIEPEVLGMREQLRLRVECERRRHERRRGRVMCELGSFLVVGESR